MIMNKIQGLKYDITRGKVITLRGEELEIKEHKQWKYVNYNGTKIGLSKIPTIAVIKDDYVGDYIFGGTFLEYPCPAMDYWIYRHRLGNKISVSDYKKKFKVIFHS